MSQAFIQVFVDDLAYLDRLSHGALKLYLLLRARLNRTTGKCCPSYEALGWKRSTYYTARAELEKFGIAVFDGFNVTFCSPEVQESGNPGIPDSKTPKSRIPGNPPIPPYKEEPEEHEPKENSSSARVRVNWLGEAQALFHILYGGLSAAEELIINPQLEQMAGKTIRGSPVTFADVKRFTAEKDLPQVRFLGNTFSAWVANQNREKSNGSDQTAGRKPAADNQQFATEAGI